VGRIRTHRELDVYEMAFEVAMEIFELSKAFPREEMFSLTDQIRRSSRSVRASLGEAWRRRRYQAAFASKLNDSEAEAGPVKYLGKCQSLFRGV
jgi:four helix bundle protein